MTVRYDIIFAGRVQGVFFRATTERVARDFAVTGYVCNLRNGSVRCVAEGDAAELDRFVSAVEVAQAGNIDDTTIQREVATGEFAVFAIRH
ncbi:MAG: acylphosphatase [Planctomycetes bacterium]|nr:acylphosphatase [Planctomycetota bacterium]